MKLFDVAAPRLTTLSIAGPYNATGIGESASRQKIFVCKPTSATNEDRCAATIVSSLARRAYRRAVTAADLTPLLNLYKAGKRDGGFEDGIEMALRAILVSPNFLFRVEADKPGSAPSSVHRLSDHELASRLSFFLWSSIPDEELLNLADRGKLKDPAILSAQVSRA
ncbi:MAG: DUF1595 domain-containing protein [Bryobacteraceae bacterium]